ncbi:phosphopantetheine-binding protein [Pseudonocardia endophytica]|uniref:Acyl carrier protein n=1 Tax=Pseudonocardia endophytica TaxID=401976 RepID=A0A4R1HNU5_PSEEN|nr:phosphopantetheine-binding protein [Pseudonocardia endophytica]TCK22295.1 acyl carrier protein [Pseudonocardia endophytica]
MDAKFQDILLAHLQHADTTELHESDDLSALGLDSMGVVQLMTDLEDTYEFVMPDEALTEETFATVGSLWRTVYELVASGETADV